jgi:hypothetical protein
MKLTHSDALTLIAAARAFLTAHESLIAAIMDATDRNDETLRERVISICSSTAYQPPYAAAARIHLEEQFYEKNLARLTRQSRATRRHEEKKEQGLATRRNPFVYDGEHRRPQETVKHRKAFEWEMGERDRMAKTSPAFEKMLESERLGRERDAKGVDAESDPIGQVFFARPSDVTGNTLDLPDYAKAETAEETFRLKAIYDAEHGVPPSRPVFAVEESQRAKESDATDELSF